MDLPLTKMQSACSHSYSMKMHRTLLCMLFLTMWHWKSPGQHQLQWLTSLQQAVVLQLMLLEKQMRRSLISCSAAPSLR